MKNVDPANLLGAAIAYLVELVAGAAEPPPQAGDELTAVGALVDLAKPSRPRAAQLTDFTTCTRRFVRAPMPILVQSAN